MGPEPMTSTERRSSRLGMAPPRATGAAPARCPSGPFHQRAERAELARRVVWAWRRLGVVLHAERGRVEQPDPLDHAVVEVDVADLGPAERRAEGLQRHRAHCPGAGGATAKPWLWLVICTFPVA